MGVELGTLAVRRSILIKAPPERVWQEFESWERMNAWWSFEQWIAERYQKGWVTCYEPKLGGWFEVVCAGLEGTFHFGGKIIVFDPGRELTCEWDAVPSKGWPAPTLLTLRLTPQTGGTLVELFHHAFERIGPEGPELHRELEDGWELTELEALRQLVEA